MKEYNISTGDGESGVLGFRFQQLLETPSNHGRYLIGGW